MFPQDIKVVTGNCNVITHSRQLFNNSATSIHNYDTTPSKINTGIRATCTGTGNNRYSSFPLDGDLLLGKTLTLSATITPSASNNGAIRLFFWNGTTEISKINPNNLTSSGSITFTVPDEYPSGSTGIVITFSSNGNGTAVANDYTDYTNVMLVEGSTAVTTYEDYVAPTTYPLSLGTSKYLKIGTYKDKLFRTNGENIFDYVNTTVASSYGALATKEDNGYKGGYAYLINFQKPIKRGTYAYSIDVTNADNKTGAIMQFRNQSNTTILGINVHASSSGLITLSEDAYCARVDNGQTATTTLIRNIMLEKLSSPTEYKPYGRGKWYKHEAIAPSLTLNGSEDDWAVFSADRHEYQYKYTRDYSPIEIGNFLDAISNTYASSKESSLNMADLSFTYFLGGSNANKNLYFRFRNNSISSLDDFLDTVETNNITIYYVWTEPKTIEITDTTLISQLEAIHLKTGKNVIEFSGDTLVSGMDINYIGEASPHL